MEKKWTTEVIKLGRINTTIFKGDCIQHNITNNKLIYIASQDRVSGKFDMDEFIKFVIEYTDEKGIYLDYYIGHSVKCSKQLFNKWLKFPNIKMEDVQLPNSILRKYYFI